MKSTTSLLTGLLAVAALVSPALSASRVGPVSQYGQLQAGTNTSGKGRIFGSCPDYAPGSNNTVQVKGMSMYWSILKSNTDSYWNSSSVSSFVSNYGMEIVRAAIGVDLNWGDGNYFSNSTYYEGKIDAVVNAAIANDIYVIIDYHSHCAETHTSDAVNFFSHMAEKWGSYDNVIFEIYNEPIGVNETINCEGMQSGQTLQTPSTYWKNAVRPYANTVISAIREYSDNLVIVGTPQWDQHPEVAIGNKVTDPANNTAYAMHYYAGTHTSSGEGSVGANTVSAINAGISVFVSEWGTSEADGDTYGGVSANNTWQSFVNQHQLSSANWSMAALKEGSAFYTASGSVSTSGQYMISNVLPGSSKTYTSCNGSTPVTPTLSSSSVKSSSSSYKDDDFTYSSSTQSSASSDTDWDDATVNTGKWTSTNTTISSKSYSKVIFKALNSGKYRKASITAKVTEGTKYYVKFNVVTESEDEGALRIQIKDDNGSIVENEYDISTESQFISIPFKATSGAVTIVATIAATDDYVAITDFDITTTQAIAQATATKGISAKFANNTLQLSGTNFPVKVQIFDITGHSMKTVNISSGTGAVSLEGMARGQYVVKIVGKAASKILNIAVK